MVNETNWLRRLVFLAFIGAPLFSTHTLAAEAVVLDLDMPLPSGPPAAADGPDGPDDGYNTDPTCYPQSSGDIKPLLPLEQPVDTPAIGETAGEFQVAQDGRAHYSIPINVPPGIGGLSPKLSFEYDSGGGNGVMGIGWSISGLSAISRCPKTIAIDGFNRAVVFDNSDAFCLDGKRLVSVGTEGDDLVLRTKAETFTKVVARNWQRRAGPSSFVAYTRDGRVSYFGSNPEKFGSQVTTFDKIITSWHVDVVSDRSPNGTQYTVNYTNELTNGDQDFRPIAVHYNYKPTSGGSASENDGMSVIFNYETTRRRDPVRVYRGGSHFKNAYRLSNVTVRSCAHAVRRYNLTYEYSPLKSTARSRLKQVQECANTYRTGTTVQWACKPATQFDWQNGNEGWANATDVTNFGVADPYWTDDRFGLPLPPYNQKAGERMSTIPPPIGWNDGVVFEPLMVDLDGNGTPEMIQFLGFDNDTTKFSIHRIDEDGTGHTRTLSIDTSAIVRVQESQSHPQNGCRDPNARPINHKSHHSAHGNAHDGGKPNTHAIPMDYDADGRIDLVLLDPTSNWIVLKQTSTSNSFETIAFTAVDTQIPRECPSTTGIEPVVFIDMNGDGLKDLLECRRTFEGRWSWWYRQSTPSGFNPVAWNTALYGANLNDAINSLRNADGTFFGQHCNYADILVIDHDGDGASELFTTDESYYSESAPYAMGPVPADTALLRSLRLHTQPSPAYETTTVAVPPSFSSGERGLHIPRFQGEQANWMTASYHTLDFTGDGYEDIMIVENHRPDFANDPSRVALTIYQGNANGRGWFDQQIGKTTFDPWINGNMDLYGNHIGAFDLIVDSNHDGKPDLLLMSSFYDDDQTWVDGVLQTYYFGNGLADRSHHNSRYEVFRLDPSGDKYRRSCDEKLGGDGCGDPSGFPNDGPTYYRSGRLRAGYQMGALPPFPTIPINLPFIPVLTDINADGLQDLLITKPADSGQSASETFQVLLAKGKKPDLLVSIRDGLNCPGGPPCSDAIAPTVKISYDTLGNGTIYEPNPTGCVFPQRCIPATGATTVVASVSYDSGTARSRDYRYEYTDARSDAHGRGFLGFRTITVSRVLPNGQVVDFTKRTYDNGTELSGANSYDAKNLSYPTAGMLLREERHVYTDISKTRKIVDTITVQPITQWLDTNLAKVASTANSAITYYSRPKVTTTIRTDNGVVIFSKQTDNTFDRYGNVTTETVTAPGQDNRIDETTKTYFDDQNSWLLGLPHNVTVKSTVPPAAPVIREERFEYDLTTTTPHGVKGTGFVLSHTIEPNVAVQKLTTTYKRDYQVVPDAPSRVGNVVQVNVVGPDSAISTPNGAHIRQTSFSYDDKGQFLRTKTNSLGQVTTFTYDRYLGVLVGESFRNNATPYGIINRWAYDAFGRPILEQHPDGKLVAQNRGTTSADNLNMVAIISYNDGKRLFQYFDRRGRVISAGRCGFGSVQSGDSFACQPVKKVFVYDEDGRIERESNEEFDDLPVTLLRYTRYKYDYLGREIHRTLPDGGIVTNTYEGQITKTTNAMGHSTAVHKDRRGRIAKIADALGGNIVTEFGAFDQPISTVSPASVTPHNPYLNASLSHFDNYSRQLTHKGNYDVVYSKTTYNAFGEVETETNANGDVARFTYDSVGRRVTRTDVEGTTTWTWDDMGLFGQTGKLAQVAIAGSGGDAGNMTRYAYSLAGQLIGVNQVVGSDSEVDPVCATAGAAS
jgi:YD repeat-containing protein